MVRTDISVPKCPPQARAQCTPMHYSIIYLIQTALKAQHDSHWPRFFTGVTSPFSLQSTWCGSGARLAGVRYVTPSV